MTRGELDADEALRLVGEGSMNVEGRLVDASNATFYCEVSLDGMTGACVYKPVRGERPLRDFPSGSLANREVATYQLSAATGWNLVPPTLLRDGPFGEGMCQLWIEHDTDIGMVDVVPREQVPDGWRRVLDAYDGDGDEIALVHADDPSLRQLAIFDVICNNADRKGGHVLVAAEDQSLFGVDHGLTFHVDHKLRTVLWGWAGERLSAEELEVLEKLQAGLSGGLGEALAELIDLDEIVALSARISRLRREGAFPEPGDGWPSIPWPVF
ncbi:SCO1664 family protein [Flindersiella endophytica]